MRPIKKGSTDQSCVIRIIDSTTGLPETAVEYDTSGIDLWFRREGETKTSITEAALAALDTAHSDGGIEHISDGYYRLDLPDAAVAAGSGENGVMVGGTITGMIVIGTYIPLVDYDPYDTVRLGLTALPNAASDAAGGLPISDAGGLDLDTKLANTNEITVARMGALTDWINGGRLDLILDIIAADTTTDIPALIAAAQADLDIITGADGVTLATLQGLYAPNVVVPDAAGVAPTTAEIKTAIEAAGSHLALILEDSGTTIPGTITTMQGNITSILADTEDIQAQIGTAGDGLTNITLAGDLSATMKASVNTEVDNALNTAIPATPTADSINEYIQKMKYVMLNKTTVTKATGTSVILKDNDSDIYATVVGAYAEDATHVIRLRLE